jgi:hypothetical protein
MWPTGTGVEVRNRYDGRWSAGFEIADIERDLLSSPGYRLRRRSDHAVLPAVFDASQLRRK